MFLLRPWNVGKIFGIPLRIDPSWLAIFLLLVYQLGFVVFPYTLGVAWRPGIAWDVLALAVIASLLLFASVVAHELAHAFMARWRGVPVLGITLFIFGGVAQIADEPDSPATEFLIAIVGPLISFVLALLSGAVWIWLQALDGLGMFAATPAQRLVLYVSVVAFYLAQTNLLLAVFNLLPGFPLDGGRVLRAAMWAMARDQRRATYWGMLSGRVMAALLAAGGAYLLWRGEYGGVWLFLMAWFLWRAANDAYQAMLARDVLKQVTVGELMRAPLQRISETLSLRELAIAFTGWLKSPALAIDLNGNAVGLVALEQVRKRPAAEWEGLRVRQVMQPLALETSVQPTDLALRALELLTRGEQEQLTVVQDGQIAGAIGRLELARYLEARGV
ncbi:MAG: putative zinc metalloprotease Rip3 [Anaerolineae bacterium]|nr:putative zinc metalloprotease Rip3 [Anaerolineae bacterium]